MTTTIDPSHFTRSIHGGVQPDAGTGAIVTPLHQTTTYVQDGVGSHRGHTYSRDTNPTVSALEAALGAIEDAPPAVCLRTGMAAITTLLLTVLEAGDHLVVSDVVYGGTVRLAREFLEKLGVTVSFVDTSRAAEVASAVGPATRLVFVETPANPTLKLTDVAAVAAVTRAAGIPLAVDNTFLTPVLLQPLELGADVAVYSTTKFLEGHNATVGGSLTTRDDTLLEGLRRTRKTLGCIQSPHDAWLTLRGLKTLPLRLERHSRSAAIVARWLEQHPAVGRVLYPGLASSPQADLAARQHAGGHGGVLAFDLRGGTPAALTLLANVELCSLAENLGAVETLITHPVTMTHGDVPRAQREAAGVTDGLVRLSVGLEDPDDIIADLEAAIAVACDNDKQEEVRHAEATS